MKILESTKEDRSERAKFPEDGVLSGVPAIVVKATGSQAAAREGTPLVGRRESELTIKVQGDRTPAKRKSCRTCFVSFSPAPRERGSPKTLGQENGAKPCARVS